MRRLLLLVPVLAALPAAAQTPGLREVRERGAWGLNVQLASPVGEFRRFVGTHGGVGLGVVLGGGPLGVRLQGSYLVYGHERRPVPLGGGLVWLDLSTTNQIATLSIAPQLMLDAGALRAYGYAGLGVSWFGTTSSLDGYGHRHALAETLNYDDATRAIESGAGLQLRIAGRRVPVRLDLGVRYLENGRVRYLTESSLIEQPDGTFAFQAIESDANSVVWHLGVAVGLR